MTRKRVLFILQLPPPLHGVSLMNEIIRKSATINGYFDCDYINLTTATSIEDLQKNAIRKYFRTAAIFLKAIYFMCRYRYAKVYITIFPYGFAFIKDSLIVLLAKLFGYQPYLHLHTYGFREHSGRSKRKQAYYRKVFRNTRPICLSAKLVHDIEGIYRGSVCILPNGIHPTNFENKYLGNQDPPVILYLSNLLRGKGVLLLVEAAKILRDKNYRFNLRIVGPEGNVSYAEVRSLVKKYDLGDRVILTGPKFDGEKNAELQGATVFTLPSTIDAFGIVFLEAMQYGVPCVATGINAIPDILGDGRGVIIQQNTAECLAESLAFLLDNPAERMRISVQSFSYFHDNFTVSVFEDSLIRILDDRPKNVDYSLVEKEL